MDHIKKTRDEFISSGLAGVFATAAAGCQITFEIFLHSETLVSLVALRQVSLLQTNVCWPIVLHKFTNFFSRLITCYFFFPLDSAALVSVDFFETLFFLCITCTIGKIFLLFVSAFQFLCYYFH